MRARTDRTTREQLPDDLRDSYEAAMAEARERRDVPADDVQQLYDRLRELRAAIGE